MYLRQKDPADIIRKSVKCKPSQLLNIRCIIDAPAVIKPFHSSCISLKVFAA